MNHPLPHTSNSSPALVPVSGGSEYGETIGELWLSVHSAESLAWLVLHAPVANKRLARESFDSVIGKENSLVYRR